MNIYQSAFMLFFLTGIFSGCVYEEKKAVPEVVPVVEKVEKTEPKQPEPNHEVSSLDFKRAIQTAVRNMGQSGALDNPSGNKYTVAISSIVDTTKKGFDISAIKQNLSADLVAGRKVRVVSVSSKNAAPQMFIAGRITQRTAYVRNGKRQEYYLHLVLTEAKSGIKLWENTTPVVKKKKKTNENTKH